MESASKVDGRQRREYAARMPDDERRQQLVDAARRIIMREGHGGVTADAVAAEAGVTKPVIYRVFDNLTDLRIAVLEQWQREAIDQLFALPWAATPDPGKTAVARVVHRWCAVVVDNPQTWSLIFRPRASAPPEVQERIEGGRELARQFVADSFDRMLGPRQDNRNRLLAEVIIAAGEQFGRRLLDDPDSCPIDEWVALFEDLIYGPRMGRRPPV